MPIEPGRYKGLIEKAKMCMDKCEMTLGRRANSQGLITPIIQTTDAMNTAIFLAEQIGRFEVFKEELKMPEKKREYEDTLQEMRNILAELRVFC